MQHAIFSLMLFRQRFKWYRCELDMPHDCNFKLRLKSLQCSLTPPVSKSRYPGIWRRYMERTVACCVLIPGAFLR